MRKDLRAIYADGAACNVMVGIGETFLPAFVLAISSNQLASGFVVTVPYLAGALLQLVSPWAVGRLGSYRRWVVLCAILQAGSFVPLAAAALLGAMPLGLIFLAVAVYWGTSMAGGPAWNAWVGTLVPRQIRARYFARRTRAAQLALLLSFAAGGLVLHSTRQEGAALAIFAWLFIAAAASRLVSAKLLDSQRELTAPVADMLTLRPRALMNSLRRDADPRMLVYMVAIQAAVQFAGPYFTPYMLRHLELGYGRYAALICAAYLAKVLVLPWLGRFAARHGAERLLWIGGLTIAPIPALWLLGDAYWYLFAVQMLSGAAWGAHELAQLLLFIDTIPTHKRLAILTAWNLANATAILLGSLAGGLLLGALGASPAAYWTLFVISSLARVMSILLLVSLPARSAVPAMPASPVSWRPAWRRRRVASGSQSANGPANNDSESYHPLAA